MNRAHSFLPDHQRGPFPRTFMSRTVIVLLAVIVTIIASSCANLNDTRYANVLGTEKNLILVAYDIAEDLEKQAYPPLIPRNPEQPILTTTFVDNNDLNKTSRFSRIMQEHLTSRLVQLGYTVREIKLRNQLDIEPYNGEKILSRNLNDIEKKHHAQAVSVGTYSVSDTAIYISARMIDPANANILSSVDYKLIMDKNIMAMFGIRPREQEGIIPIEEPRQSFITRLLY